MHYSSIFRGNNKRGEPHDSPLLLFIANNSILQRFFECAAAAVLTIVKVLPL